jgi:hypothetical protein
LLERSGKTDRGSITGFYTVLVEADDANEPISDTVRGILDGHIMLSRKLAHQAHWPAIDVLSSISRSMPDVTSDEHRRNADSLKQLLAAYQETQDLISIGAYQAGSNGLVDAAFPRVDSDYVLPMHLNSLQDLHVQRAPDHDREGGCEHEHDQPQPLVGLLAHGAALPPCWSADRPALLAGVFGACFSGCRRR